MFKERIMENAFYTDKKKAFERVQRLNEITESNNYWYQTLDKY